MGKAHLSTPGDTRHELSWPERLIALCRELRRAAEGTEEQVLGSLWLLVVTSLKQLMRVQSRRLGYVAEADLDDIASQKALELLRRFDQEGWSLADGAPGEVRAFLARVARNGLVDHLRRTGRRAEETLDEVRELRTDDLPGSSEELAAPDARVERSRFVDALVDCAGRLKPRDRTVWIFRAFYGMSSKEIARHPEVRLKPAHVDVLLKRVRDSLRACMKQKGYVPGDMPPGSFAAIWAAFRLRALPFVGGTHE